MSEPTANTGTTELGTTSAGMEKPWCFCILGAPAWTREP